MPSLLVNLALSSFKLGYGLVTLAGIWLTAAIKDGALTARDSEADKKELAAAQRQLWSLDREPFPGFRHAFLRTRTGLSLHYVVNAESNTSASKPVVLFIHGFPDSFVVWRHLLENPELQQRYILIAVDLPEYGGSDGLPSYGTTEVLETMTEFIVRMRQLYLVQGQRFVIATHDWGAAIGARLAAEAGILADHWIITSVIIPHIALANAQSNWTIAKQMLHTMIYQRTNLHLCRKAYDSLDPIIQQIRSSFYIFCFNLPRPLSTWFATFGNYWFLRLLHSLTKGKPKRGEKLLARLNAKEAAEAMATTTGPGIAQLDQTFGEGTSALRYGESIRRRLNNRGMSEKIRIYRENLAFGTWDKSLETAATLFDLTTSYTSHASPVTSGVLLDNAPKGAFQAPVTVIMGEEDRAFDLRLAFNSVREYLVHGGQVVLIRGVGHWVPLEERGREVLRRAIVWALNEEGEGEGRKEKQNGASPFGEMEEVRVLVEV